MGQYLYPFLFCWFIPLCCLSLGSQLLFWSQFSCRCRTFGTSGRQSHSSSSLVEVFLQAVLGSVPPQPRALPLQRLPSVQAGPGLPAGWCDTVSHTGCCRHSGEHGCGTAQHPKGARGFLWKCQQCGWHSIGAHGPAPAWWSLGVERRPREASQSLLAVGWQCMPYYFHALQLKDLLSSKGLLVFFFRFFHLHSRLSAFLLSSDCRLATTFIFILGVGDPSILRVSYRKLSASQATVLFQHVMVFPTDPAADTAHLPRNCSLFSYSGILLWKICYIINWYARNYPKKSEIISVHRNVRERVSALKIFFVFLLFIIFQIKLFSKRFVCLWQLFSVINVGEDL